MSLCTKARLWTLLITDVISTRSRSIATNWRKNSMIGVIADTSRMAWALVVVLQILGLEGLVWSTHRWSQNDLSPVRFFQISWKRSTNSFCIENTLLASYDRWNLSTQARPSGYRPLQFDHVRVDIHEIQNLSRIDCENLWNTLLMYLVLK